MDILGSISSIFGQAGDVLSNTGTVLSNTWEAAVQNLKQKALEFRDLFTWLQSKSHIAARDPVVKAEYDKVMARGSAVRTGVEKTTGGIDWVTGQLREKFGINSRATMGAIPMIPIAVIAAAIAAITAWLADAYKLKSKIQYLEQHNITGGAAIDVLNGNPLNSMIGIAAIGAVLYFIYKGK